MSAAADLRPAGASAAAEAAGLAALVPTAAGGGVLGLLRPDGARGLAAFGVVDAVDDGPRPARVDDRFLLSSVTKGLTALQVLVLVGEGRVALDAPVAGYVPEFAVHGKDGVTVAQLLSHAGGLDEGANTAEGPDAARPPAAHLAAALAARTTFAPGTAAAYSSPGFWVLAELVARVSGAPSHAEHLRDAVLGPLGLADTGYAPAAAPPARYVLPAPGRARGAHHEWARRNAYPAGGVVGTAADLLELAAALGRAHADGSAGPLDRALVDRLRTPRSAGRWLGDDVRWSLGWELRGPGRAAPADAIFVSGGSGTALLAHPASGAALVVLTAGWALERAALGRLCDAASRGWPA